MKKKILSILSLALVAATTSNAVSFVYNFSQGGYSEGATITGKFSVEDTAVLDGIIDSSEIIDFMVSFSGNSLVPAFSIAADALATSVFYDLDGTIGNDLGENVGAIGLGKIYDAFNISPFSSTVSTGVSADLSFQQVAVADPVKVPDTGSTSILLIGSVLAIAAIRRRLR